MQVLCEIKNVELAGDHEDRPDWTVSGVCATCSRCGHEVESYGTAGRSVRRCLVVMREECPNGESNFYVPDPPDPDGNL